MAKTQEQVRAGNRQRQQNRRDRLRLEKEAANQTHQTEQAWWAANRADNPPTPEALALHEECLSEIHFMLHGDPNNEFFVEDVQGLLWFIEEHGVAHTGYITRDQSIPPDWETGGILSDKRPYWHSSDLITKLCAESPATKNHILYGLWSGLPDHVVIEFLKDNGWPDEKARNVCGQVFTDRGECVYR